jgi:RNA polymerase-binding transcription factor DksA
MNAKDPSNKSRGAANAVEEARGPATTIALLGGASNPGNTVAPRKWARHYRNLLALRAHFETERRGHALAASQPVEPFSLSMADAATDEFDRALALSVLSAEQDALYEIDAALCRIKDGSYGICEVTGKPIPEARLRALPWTRYAADVERQLEREGKGPHVRLGAARSVSGSAPVPVGEVEAGEEAAVPPASDETLSPTD